jgi:hypothetical protein
MSAMRDPIPEGLWERLYSGAILVLAIAAVVWLNQPQLLWPAFIVALVLISVDRWRRGVYPWSPRSVRHESKSAPLRGNGGR